MQSLWGYNSQENASTHWKGCLVLEFKDNNLLMDSALSSFKIPIEIKWKYINIGCNGIQGNYKYGYICEYGYLILILCTILYNIIYIILYI